MAEKKKKEPTFYILGGNQYTLKEITFETLCQDVVYRKDEAAKKFMIDNKDRNFLQVRKEYLSQWGNRAKSKKDKALELMNW